MSYHALGRDGCPTGYEPAPDGCQRIPPEPPPPDIPVPVSAAAQVAPGLLLACGLVLFAFLMRD